MYKWKPVTLTHINLFPNDKILDVTKIKAFAYDKLNIATMMISLFHRVENTVGKGEKAVRKTVGERRKYWYPTSFSLSPYSTRLSRLLQKITIVSVNPFSNDKV